MKLLCLTLLLSAGLAFAEAQVTDPFAAGRPVDFAAREVKSIVIETNRQEALASLEAARPSWVKEEICIEDPEVVRRWVELYKSDEASNDDARNQYYIGEPVLCHVALRDSERQSLRWFPVGAPGLVTPDVTLEELQAHASTAFGKEILAFLHKNRRAVIHHYVERTKAERAWRQKMERASRKTQP